MHLRRKSYLVFSIMALTVLAVVIAGCGDEEQAECDLPDDAAACVGDVVITKEDVANRIENLRKVYGPMVVPEDADGDGVPDEAFTNMRREVTKQIVREELQFIEEERHDITVSEEEIDEYLLAFADTAYIGDYEAMLQDYEERGVSEEELREQSRRDLGHVKLEEKMREDIEVTDDDALSYYQEHEEQYVQPDRASTRQLIVDDEKTAQEAVVRARSGESMVDLVVELSVDPEKDDKKGSLGLVYPGQLAEELDRVVFDLEINEISDPIQVGNKWYVLTVEAKVPGYNYSFDEKKEEIKYIYGNQLYADAFKQMIDDLLEETPISYHPDYDPDLIIAREEETSTPTDAAGAGAAAPAGTEVEVGVPQS